MQEISGMLQRYQIKYTKTPSGYMGQVVEWPEVVTEGKTLAKCRETVEDALKEMVLAYRQLGKEIPKLSDDERWSYVTGRRLRQY